MDEKKRLKLKQSNALILATHEMNIQQMRLFFFVCSLYRGDLAIDVPIEDLYKVLATEGGQQRESLRKAIPTMMRNAFVHIEDEEKDGWCCVLTESYISKTKPICHFEFNKTIRKELEELHGYTWMYLTQLTGMSSTYAVRLYEFFAMRLGANNNSGEFDFDINLLRQYLDCTKKYQEFESFDRRVLRLAKEQINEKTNITMDYKKVKTWRSVTSVVFTFKWKNKDDAITVAEEPKQRETTYSDDEYAALDERIKKLNE